MSFLRGWVVLVAFSAVALGQPVKAQSPEGEKKATPEKNLPARTDLYGVPLPPDALTRMGVPHLHGHHHTAWSPDSKVLALGGGDGVIHLWDLKSDKLLRRHDGYRNSFTNRTPVGYITALAFSPDGKAIASSAYGETTIHYWEAATGKELRQFVGHKGLISSIAFGQDGKTLASAGTDYTVRLWEVGTGKQFQQISMREQSLVGSVSAFSPDSGVLALAGILILEGNEQKPAGGGILLWDVTAGKMLRRLATDSPSVSTAAFSPDGKTLISGNYDKTLCLWEVATGKELRRFKAETPEKSGFYVQLALSQDGSLAAVTGAHHDGPETGRAALIHLWDVGTGKELRQLPGHRGYIGSLTFSPDGTRLASTGFDRTTRLWEVETGRELRQIGRGHRDMVAFLAFAADGKTLASAAKDETMRFWDVCTGREVRQLQGRFRALSPDGRLWATLAWNPRQQIVLLQEVATGKELRRFEVEMASAAAFSPDGRVLAIGGWRATLLWDVTTGQEVARLEGSTGPVGFSPDGKFFVTTIDRTIQLWDRSTGKLRLRTGGRRFDSNPRVDYYPPFAFSPDNKTLAAGCPDNRVQLWELATGRQGLQWTVTSERQESLKSLAFSADYKVLAGGCADHDVWLWELATGGTLRRLRGHEAGVSAVAFSPDGTRLASGSADTTVLIWDGTAMLLRRRLPAGPLSPQLLDALWATLSGADVAEAQQAISALAIHAGQSVSFLEARLGAVPATDPRRMAQLLADLDDQRFVVRQKASRELEELGELAEPTLRQALSGKPSLEVRRRLEQLLAKREETVWPPGQLRTLRAIEVLEHIGSVEAQQVLHALAKGAPARLTQEAKASLERLAKRGAVGP